MGGSGGTGHGKGGKTVFLPDGGACRGGGVYAAEDKKRINLLILHCNKVCKG